MNSAVLKPYSGPLVMSGTLPAETFADHNDRPVIDLNGPWFFQFDYKNRGLARNWHLGVRDVWQMIPVPGSWDNDLLNGFNQKTVGWYTRQFELESQPDRMFKLQFDGIFREAKIWLNGTIIGEQRVPYVPFQYDVTAHLRFGEANTLVVRVDNRIRLFTLPCSNIFTKQKHGWFPYGGITRPVRIEAHLPVYPAQVRINPLLDGTVHADVMLEHRASGRFTLNAWVTPEGDDAVLHEWPEIEVPAGRSSAFLDCRLSDVRHWSPQDPAHRYVLHLSVQSPDGESDHTAYTFAFRTFEARDGRFYLNGRNHFLRGMNRHEDHSIDGPTFQEASVQGEINLLEDLNVDFVRPGHYPVDVRTLKALEDAGIMVVEEIPVYQLNTFQLLSRRLRRLAREALEVTIIRDYNRPGVVMWSISNEIHPWFPAASRFTRDLRQTALAIDAGRPVMMARVTLPAPLTVLDIFDRACGEVDVVGVNQYVGWYFGKTHQVARVIKRAHRRHPEQTWMISEYGADALRGRHLEDAPGEEPSRDHSYSEEFQVYYHQRHLQEFEKLPFLRGIMPWVLADFRMEWSPNTGKPHPVPLMNLKGLTSFDRKPKSLFKIIADHYLKIKQAENDEPDPSRVTRPSPPAAGSTIQSH